ncbi:MAG: hypothetical protein KF825_01145 [Ferruginibacter sp.]|nr:hypothetical protein [Bacteroidota bacterium]MBX2917698.1 hypothetical protein [Ferruginibacter sp.]MBX2932818.1 hypothetical protein [Ferruginibacter sp.]MCB0707854.1 hypothetical protein [Chitinophagaceae bacterium]MCC7378282.1 hypothetical protein [Chitinophagaceae bacterium]
MKKILLLATAFMFVTGVALADNGKKKNKKKCAKGKTCCTKDAKAKTSKSCCSEKSTTAKM